MTSKKCTYSKGTNIILTALLSLNLVTSFTLRTCHIQSIKHQSTRDTTAGLRPIFPLFVGSSETQPEKDAENDQNVDDEPKLILSNDVLDSIGSLGTGGGYLEAAKKRNEEAKKKLLEDTRKEEEAAEAWRKERADNAGEDNYGPGDMAGFKGFVDDGFEGSLGNDAEGGWMGAGKEEENEDEKEEPKLFLFGDDDKGDGANLIL